MVPHFSRCAFIFLDVMNQDVGTYSWEVPTVQAYTSALQMTKINIPQIDPGPEGDMAANDLFLIVLMLYILVSNFPVIITSYNVKCLAQGHNIVPTVSLELATL